MQELLHFSTCLPRNDICTAEPNTIIYSSPHRKSVHDARVQAAKDQHVPPLQTNFPPSKRSLAPLKEVEAFVNRFRTYHKSKAEFQQTNPEPNRPTSSSSQPDSEATERLTRTSYNVYMYAPKPLIQRGRGEILQHLKLHVSVLALMMLISTAPNIFISSPRTSPR